MRKVFVAATLAFGGCAQVERVEFDKLYDRVIALEEERSRLYQEQDALWAVAERQSKRSCICRDAYENLRRMFYASKPR